MLTQHYGIYCYICQPGYHVMCMTVYIHRWMTIYGNLVSASIVFFFFFGTCVGEEVTSGQIEIDLKWGIFPIDQKEDLCTVLKQSGKACPLEPGTQTMTLSQTIPSVAPSVSHHLKAQHTLWGVLFLGGGQLETLCPCQVSIRRQFFKWWKVLFLDNSTW